VKANGAAFVTATLPSRLKEGMDSDLASMVMVTP
jgi:hypothetical protein